MKRKCATGRSGSLLVLLTLTGLARGAAAQATPTPGDLSVSANLTLPEDVYAFVNVTVSNGAVLTLAGGTVLNASGTLRVMDDSMIVVQSKNTGGGMSQGIGGTINAGGVTVEAGSTISADGQGYIGTAGPGAGASDQFCNAAAAGGGGGYGGTGGSQESGASGGPTYGSPVAPTDLGSGGGNNPAAGCGQNSTVNAGGGAIRLTVAGTLQLDGAISANGAPNLPQRLGGGAGGSIYVTTGTLSGSGSFSANGADAGSSSAGGGGGGRIAVYYANGATFSGFAGSTADGGSGFTPGGTGTAAFFDTSVAPPHLYVYQRLVFSQDSSITYSAITLDNGATFRVGGGSTIDLSGDLIEKSQSMLLLEGKNTSGLVNGVWQGVGVTINVANVMVEAGSTISADGQGYIGTAGPGAGASDQSCSGGTAGGGGGYGGAGGSEQSGASGGSTYGSSVAPTDLGSGGGNNPAAGCGQSSTVNAGGEAIRLIVG